MKTNENRRSVSNRLSVPVVFGALGVLLSGIVGHEIGSKSSAPEIPKSTHQSSNPPPLPVVSGPVVILAQAEQSNTRLLVMTAEESTNPPPAPELTVKTALPLSAPAADYPTNRGTVTLAWDASPDTNVVGYRIVFGAESGLYSQSSSIISNATTVHLVGLEEGRLYFAACVAIDRSGVMSVPSNEVEFHTRFYINMRVHSRIIEAYGSSGKTNLLQRSEDLTNWTTVRTFIGINALQSYIQQDNQKSFFRVIVK